MAGQGVGNSTKKSGQGRLAAEGSNAWQKERNKLKGEELGTGSVEGNSGVGGE